MAKQKLSEEIRKRLKERGWSITEFARRLDISDGSLRVGIHRNSFPHTFLQKMLAALELEVDLEKIAKQYEFRLPKRQNPKDTFFESTDAYPLLAGIVESGYKGKVTIEDLKFLLSTHQSLNRSRGNLSPSTLADLLQLRHSEQ